MKQKRNKLLSGRLWLTIIAGLSFLSFTLTSCHLLYFKRNDMTASEITNIINMLLIVVSNIFTFYFTKSRNEDNEKTITEQLEENQTEINEITKDI